MCVGGWVVHVNFQHLFIYIYFLRRTVCVATCARLMCGVEAQLLERRLTVERTPLSCRSAPLLLLLGGGPSSSFAHDNGEGEGS